MSVIAPDISVQNVALNLLKWIINHDEQSRYGSKQKDGVIYFCESQKVSM